MSFEEKVKSMTAKEIILSMVNGLLNPIIKVDMQFFGFVKQSYFLEIIPTKKICYGCAATNAICNISGKVFNTSNITSRFSRADFLNVNVKFFSAFENAIDELRKGNINQYNQFADMHKFAKIDNSNKIVLPVLDTDYIKEDLQPYIELANSQILN